MYCLSVYGCQPWDIESHKEGSISYPQLLTLSYYLIYSVIQIFIRISWVMKVLAVVIARKYFPARKVLEDTM